MKKKSKKLLIWGGFAAILAATLIAEFFIQIHSVFGFEGKLFFHAWFGFGSCVFLVLISKFLGFFLKRSEGYYKEGGDE